MPSAASWLPTSSCCTTRKRSGTIQPPMQPSEHTCCGPPRHVPYKQSSSNRHRRLLAGKRRGGMQHNGHSNRVWSTLTHGGRIVIVGASLAGLSAAERLRVEGFTGPLTVIGDEPYLP